MPRESKFKRPGFSGTIQRRKPGPFLESTKRPPYFFHAGQARSPQRNYQDASQAPP